MLEGVCIRCSTLLWRGTTTSALAVWQASNTNTCSTITGDSVLALRLVLLPPRPSTPTPSSTSKSCSPVPPTSPTSTPTFTTSARLNGLSCSACRWKSSSAPPSAPRVLSRWESAPPLTSPASANTKSPTATTRARPTCPAPTSLTKICLHTTSANMLPTN